MSYRPDHSDDAGLLRLVARAAVDDSHYVRDERFVDWLVARERLRAKRATSRRTPLE
nr:hypothetical protein [Gemmatimonadaceae bacterium]